jgi:Transport protein Trs120 or TRAPPC9, TRAPP II complex subunit
MVHKFGTDINLSRVFSQPSSKPTVRQRPRHRITLERKASFFVTVAAEAMSDIDSDDNDDRAVPIWSYASTMLSTTANNFVAGNYGWATLRAVTLHSLVLLGIPEMSEEAAINLLSLMSAIQPPQLLRDNKTLSLDAFHAANSGNGTDAMDSSSRGSEGFADTATYIADARSYIADARRAISKDARARSKELFSSQNAPSSLLAVAQSKWVDDNPIPPALVPLSDFTSDISNRILALKAVWSAIKLDSCSMAQTRLLGQIADMRKKSAVSSLSSTSTSKSLTSSTLTKLPVKITSIGIADPRPTAKLEKVKRKAPASSTDGANSAMATFFNPYANKNKSQQKTTLIPVGEEQYISVSFQNKLSVSLEIASCRLEFNTQSDMIKAPAISFTIPPQTKDFTVQFPFLLLDKPKLDNSVLVIAGIHVTALSRSRYYAINTQSVDGVLVGDDGDEIPPPASLYPRRKYFGGPNDLERKVVKSPRIEIVPSQPSLQIAFARARTPIEEDMVIPVPLMDGEVFHLPKLCLFNDPGMSGLGMIEELKITAHGLPGLAEVVLYDISKSNSSQTSEHMEKLSQGTNRPILITATCSGMDKETLNGSPKKSQSSYLSICLTAAPDMGGTTDGCTVTLKFRYRGAAPSETMEVWRSREIQIGVLRMKGPRISSLAFRPDLSWESGYTELCKMLASDENREPQSSVNVCTNSVVVLVMVANEAQFPITITGFDSHTLTSLRIPANVSIRVPVTLPKLDRAVSTLEQLTERTRLSWVAECEVTKKAEDKNIDTGGPMVALNRRTSRGFMEVPVLCIQNIIDENPLFISRICEAPCAITVQVDNTNTVVGKAVKVTVNVVLTKWLETSGMNATLEFCCTSKESETENRQVLSPISNVNRNHFVWAGHTCKALNTNGELSPSTARLIFLNAGQYSVSACIVLDGTQTWLAEKAAHVEVAPKHAQT